MTSINSCAMRPIESSDIWQAARHHRLYRRSDVELEALIMRCRVDRRCVERVTAEAARHVRNLRRALAAGAAL
jgi:uncharacterized protein YjiS (DUF1127 family)